MNSGQVYFLNVGQAHATIATDGERSAMLIDCPNSGVDRASQLLASFDAEAMHVVITHRDLDHCGGMPALLRRFATTTTVVSMNAAMAVSPRPSEQPRIKSVLQSIYSAIEETGASPQSATEGDKQVCGTVEWEVLSPPYIAILRTAAGGSVNRSSIVLRLTVNSRTFLITGDIDDHGLKRLLAGAQELSADVVLLPHHGARLSKLADFLDKVDATHAIISAGRAPSHPAQSTLTVAANKPCRLMCTQVSHHCEPTTLPDPQCAGEISFTMDTNGSMEVHPSPQEHRKIISRLASPAC